MKPAILFVDDEARVLEGLRDLLRRRRHEWDLRFALGGEEALAALDEARYDIVVSDMRMPAVDGAGVLSYARERQPESIRMVLSGQTQLRAAVRAIPVAHQFLVKPCNGEELQNVIERSLALRELLGDDEVRAAVGETGRLPSVPEAYAALTAAMQDPNATVEDVAAIVEGDMAMCAKLLQLVNSSFFGLARRITRVREAVAYLGVDLIRMLVLSAEVFLHVERRALAPGLDLGELQRHGLLAGRLAAEIAERPLTDDALVAGVLHDVGKLILGVRQPARLQALLREAAETGEPLHAVERRAGPITHAEVGAYLLGIWGLPYPVVEAVAHHHAPERVEQHGVDILAAVHIADTLLHEARRDPGGELDLAYVRRLGVEHRLPSWRARAVALAAADGAAA